MGMQEYYQKDEIDLADYLRIIIKRKNTIFTVFFFCFLLILAVVFLVPDIYEATCVVRIGGFSKPLYSAKDVLRELKDLNNLAELIGPFEFQGNADELRNVIDVDDLDAPGFIKMRVRVSSPGLAVMICDRLADFVVTKGNKIYDEQFRALNDQIQRLEAKKNMDDKNKISFLKKEITESKVFRIASAAVSGRRPIISDERADNIFFIFISGIFLSILIISFQEFWAKNKK